MCRLLLLVGFLLFAFPPSTFSQNTNDTLNYLIDYSEAKCEPTKSYYYRQVYKEGEFWMVKDFYLKEQTLRMSGRYINDSLTMKSGVFSYYHTNGKLAHKLRFINNMKEGLEKKYNDEGLLIDSGYYLHDIPYKVRFSWYSNKQLAGKGIYDDSGKGIGRELFYYKDGQLERSGITSEGYQKDSVWTYFHANGVVSFKEYYERGKLIQKECFDGKGQPQVGSCEAEVMPVFAKYGGDFVKYLNKALVFPPGFRIDGIGYVLAQFTIDEEGRTTDIKILKGLHYAFDKEVLYVIKNSPKWIPGKDHNHPVKVFYSIPFTFQMED